MSAETELATLGVVVKGSGVKETAAELKDLTQSGGEAQRQSIDLTRATDILAKAMASLESALNSNSSATNLNTVATKGQAESELQAARATDVARQASDMLTATLMKEKAEHDAATKSAREHADLLRRAARDTAEMESRVLALRTSIDPLVGVQARLNDELKEAYQLYKLGFIGAAEYNKASSVLNERLEMINNTHAKGVVHSKAMTQATLNLSRQFADIGVTAAMGMNPLMILIQQGPQVADAFQMASSQGLGFKDVLKGISAQAGPLLATVGPVLALGGALVSVSGLMLKGQQDQADFNNMLAITGQRALFVKTSVGDMSEEIADASNSGIGQATKTLEHFVSSGRYTADTVKYLSMNVLDLARYTGKTAEEFEQYFDGMGKDVSKFALKVNEDYKLITAAQYLHISILEKEGKTLEAQEYLSKSVHENMAKVAVEQLGIVEGAWRGVSRAIQSAIEWTKNFGKERDIGEKRSQISVLDQQIASIDPSEGEFRRSQLKMLTKLRDDYKRDVAAYDKDGEERNTQASQVKAIGKVQDRLKSVDDPSGLKGALSTLADELKLARAGGLKISDAQEKQMREAVKKDYMPISTQSSKSGASELTRGLRREDKTADALAKLEKDRLTTEIALTSDIGLIAEFKRKSVAFEAQAAKENLEREVKQKKINATFVPLLQAKIDEVAKNKTALIDQQEAEGIRQAYGNSLRENAAYEAELAGYAAEKATTIGEANRFEREALARRQRLESELLAIDNEGKLARGEISEIDAALKTMRQGTLQFAQRENQERQQALKESAADLKLRQEGLQEEIELLGSKKGLAASAYAAGKIEQEIMKKRFEIEKSNLEKVTVENGYGADAVRQAKDSLIVKRMIYDNELKQLKQSSNLVTAYTDLINVMSQTANAIASGDLGGGLSGAGNIAKQLQGMTKGGLSDMLGKAGNFLGPAGQAVSAMTSVLGAIGEKSAAKAQAKLDAINSSVEGLRADNAKSSGSIAGSLEQANRLWNQDLEYQSDMLKSLRSIDNQIDSLAVSVSRAVVTGNLLDTSGLGLGSTSGGGNLISGLSGLLLGSKKTTKTLSDQGLTFNSGTYGDIASGGISGSTYADIVSTTVKKWLGVAYSTKVSTSTVNGEVGGDLLSQVSGVIKLLGEGVTKAASVFGEDAGVAASKALANAQIDIGKISLTGLSASEISDVLNATFTKVGDDLAAAGVPGLESLAKTGEGALETLTRVARGYQVFDTAMLSMGKTFDLTGLASIAARQKVIDLAGSLEDFAEDAAFFAANFLSEAEQLAPMQKTVSLAMSKLGLSAVSTKDEFKQVVLGLDLTTEKGAEMYTALMNIAPAFLKVANASEAATKAANDEADAKVEAANLAAKAAEDLVDKARQTLQNAYDAELTRLESNLSTAQDNVAKATAKLQNAYNKQLGDYQSKLAGIENTITQASEAIREAYDDQSESLKNVISDTKQFTETLKNYKRELSGGKSAQLSPEAAYMASRDAFNTTKSAALGGDKAAQSQYATVANAFIEASKQYNATGQAFFADYDSVVNSTDLLLSNSDEALSTAERELEALEKNRDAVLGTTKAIMSLEDAIKTLETAEAAKKSVLEQIDALNALVDPILNVKEEVGTVEDAIGELLTAKKAEQIAKDEIDALNKLVQPLLTVNDSVVSVRSAIDGLSGAVMAAVKAQEAAVNAANARAAAAAAAAAQAQAQLQQAQDQIQKALEEANKPKPPTTEDKPTLPTTTVVYTWADYLKDNPDVVTEFNRLSKNNLKNNYGITTAEQFAEWHYRNSGASEGRKGAGTYEVPITPNNDNYVTTPLAPGPQMSKSSADISGLQLAMENVALLLKAGLSQNAAIAELQKTATGEVKDALDTMARRIAESA